MKHMISMVPSMFVLAIGGWVALSGGSLFLMAFGFFLFLGNVYFFTKNKGKR